MTATGCPERRPRKSASIPDEKKHDACAAGPGLGPVAAVEREGRLATDDVRAPAARLEELGQYWPSCSVEIFRTLHPA